jgi:hypothetical protein
MKRILLLLAATAFALLSLAPLALAEEPRTKQALSLSPVTEELVVDPGKTYDREVTLSNLSAIPLPIKGYARAFVATDEEGGVDTPDDTDPGAVQNWFKLDAPDFILQPNTTRKIKVSIQVPRNTPPGGHYATLFFESLVPREALSESSLYLSQRIGGLYFFVVSGRLIREGRFEQFNTKPFWQNGPIEFDLAFRNSGNIHLKPVSEVVLTDMFGRVVSSTTDEGQRVLPGGLRRWKMEIPQTWLLGRYTATLRTRIDPDSNPVATSATFWVVPVIPITLVTVFSTLIYLIFFRGRGRVRKAWRVLTFHKHRHKKTAEK